MSTVTSTERETDAFGFVRGLTAVVNVVCSQWNEMLIDQPVPKRVRKLHAPGAGKEVADEDCWLLDDGEKERSAAAARDESKPWSPNLLARTEHFPHSPIIK